MIFISWTNIEKELLINAYENKTPIKSIEELKDKKNISIARVANALGLDEKYPDFDYMVGQQFGFLKVVKKIEPRINPCGTKIQMYDCVCICKKHAYVNGQCLRNGSTKSCGCKKDFLNGISHKKYNIYDLTGKFGIGYDKNNMDFYFDLEDYELIREYNWVVDTTTGYVISTDPERNYAKIRMHRLIMGLYPDNRNIHIDHIHTERKNDNRKANLRIATRSQNGMNMKMMPQNTSGVTGVSYRKDKKLWVAYITINRKRIWLGSSKDFSKAVNLRKAAEEKYFGERSYTNSQLVQID